MFEAGGSITHAHAAAVALEVVDDGLSILGIDRIERLRAALDEHLSSDFG